MSDFSVQRKALSLVLAFATDNDSIDSSAIALNGHLAGVIINAPVLESTHTFTVTVKDADGYTIFNRAGLAQSSQHGLFVDSNNHPLHLPLSGNHTVTITTSGAQTANRTFPVVLLVDNR